MTHKLPLVALSLAVAFEFFAFSVVPGIGYLLLWTATLAVTLYLLKKAERTPRSLWMFLPSLLLTTSLFLYDAEVVRFWASSLGVLSLLWAVAWNLVPEREQNSLARLFPGSTFHPGRVSENVSLTWRNNVRWEAETTQTLARAARGLLLAVPLLFIFGTLLSSADAIFESTLTSMFDKAGNVSLASPARVLVWLALLTGWLRLWLMAPKSNAPVPKSWFGSTELLVALGSVNVMLMGFLGIQIRYLFGDTSAVTALGLSYAEYARKGFFELSACIALILPLVLTAYRASETHKDAKLRLLGGGLIFSAGGLAISAFQRMLLYIEAFGMSIERFYAASGILVAMTVLAWAAWACLRPKPVAWLLTRQTVTVLLVLGFLSLYNVEASVARFNLERGQRTQESVDFNFLGGLSSDVLPVLEEYYPRLGPEEQKLAAEAYVLISRRAGSNWGASWNLSRSQSPALSPEFAQDVAEYRASLSLDTALASHSEGSRWEEVEQGSYETTLPHPTDTDQSGLEPETGDANLRAEQPARSGHRGDGQAPAEQ